MTKTRKKLAIEDIHIKKFKSLDGKPMVNVILRVLKIKVSSNYTHTGCEAQVFSSFLHCFTCIIQFAKVKEHTC